MDRIAFDNEKYVKIQAEHILERIKMFDNKLYLEFGGKLFDDYHASRVLPGFLPDSKVRMFSEIKSKAEFIVVANASDINSNKIRSDNGLTYEAEVLRIIKTFKTNGIKTGSVVISRYEAFPNVEAFFTKVTNMGIPVYKHYHIKGYPYNTELILSDDGFGRNEYVQTTKPLVIVTAPGPGSGKMATCLSQLYNELKNGIKAGYAKYETFPIWNLPLKHPVNLAYEAATADLEDINMIDPYHLEAYNVQTVNYNRDIEVFPVLRGIFEKIYGTSPYNSPTDMGVNMAGFCITDDEYARKASCDEIVRRYFDAKVKVKLGRFHTVAVNKIKVIMDYLGLDESYRLSANFARSEALKKGRPVMALEMRDGTIVSGKESTILTAPAACLINSLKYLAGIPKKMKLLSPSMLDPIIELKKTSLAVDDAKLHIRDVLLVLAVTKSANPLSDSALASLVYLEGAQAHSTKILSYDDEVYLKKLKIDVTSFDEIE